MAKAKFEKLGKSTGAGKPAKTHADLQKIQKSKKEAADATQTFALAPSQKAELLAFATAEDRSPSYVVKKALIDAGIISRV